MIYVYSESITPSRLGSLACVPNSQATALHACNGYRFDGRGLDSGPGLSGVGIDSSNTAL